MACAFGASVQFVLVMFMKEKSTLYKLMRQSELLDDDGMDLDDAVRSDDRTAAEKFKEQYKDFYTDIKTDIKEDW